MNNTALNSLLTLGLLIILEVLFSLFGVFFSNINLRLNIAMFFCMYFLLIEDNRASAYLIFVTILIHSLFSNDSWEIMGITFLSAHLIYKIIENSFQVTSLSFSFMFGLLISVYFFLCEGVLRYLKLVDGDIFTFNLKQQVIPLLIISTCFPVFKIFLDKVWMEKV